MIVADTNLIAAFHLSTEWTQDAYAVLRFDPDWVAPGLWRSEFRNVIVNQMRHGLLSLGNAKRLTAAAESFMEGKEHDVPSSAVLEFAASSGCTAYDCEFVALAASLGVPLVTHDRKLRRAFPGTAVSVEEFLRK